MRGAKEEEKQKMPKEEGGKRECGAEIAVQEHPIVMSLHSTARPTERHRPRSRRFGTVLKEGGKHPNSRLRVDKTTQMRDLIIPVVPGSGEAFD